MIPSKWATAASARGERGPVFPVTRRRSATSSRSTLRSAWAPILCTTRSAGRPGLLSSRARGSSTRRQIERDGSAPGRPGGFGCYPPPHVRACHEVTTLGETSSNRSCGGLSRPSAVSLSISLWHRLQRDLAGISAQAGKLGSTLLGRQRVQGATPLSVQPALQRALAPGIAEGPSRRDARSAPGWAARSAAAGNSREGPATTRLGAGLRAPPARPASRSPRGRRRWSTAGAPRGDAAGLGRPSGSARPVVARERGRIAWLAPRQVCPAVCLPSCWGSAFVSRPAGAYAGPGRSCPARRAQPIGLASRRYRPPLTARISDDVGGSR